MGEEDSRNAVLARIRAARFDPAAAVPSGGSLARDVQPGGLVGRFAAAAEAAQASVCVVPDHARARRHVADILDALGCARPIVSEDAKRAPWLIAGERAGEEALAASVAGITCAAYGMADTGTIVVCSGPSGGRAESLVPPVHVALLDEADLVPGLPELLAVLARDRRFEQSSAITLITGPSRTADIELTLTIGVHGPKQLFIVVVGGGAGR